MKVSGTWILMIVLIATLGFGCEWSYAARSAGSLKPFKDERVGLCYMYNTVGAGRRVGLSHVDCELVEHTLAQNAAVAERVVGDLNYGWMQGQRSTICVAYKEDANDNLRSNMAVVPCEPIRQAHNADRLIMRQFYP